VLTMMREGSTLEKELVGNKSVNNFRSFCFNVQTTLFFAHPMHTSKLHVLHLYPAEPVSPWLHTSHPAVMQLT
jgi:hypothetical protein